MKLIFAIALSATFFTTSVYAQKKEKVPASPKGKAPAQSSKTETAKPATVAAPKIDPIPDAYSCSVVVIDPVTKETRSITKEGVQGYNETLARQNCVNELGGKTIIKGNEKYFTIKNPDAEKDADAPKELAAGAVSVKKLEPVNPDKPSVTSDEFIKAIAKEERPKFKSVREFCSKIKGGNVAAALQLKPAKNLAEQLDELKASHFGDMVMGAETIKNARSIDDRNSTIPEGSILILEKKLNSGSNCPIQPGAPVLVAKCSSTTITWPDGKNKNLESFLKDNKNCVTSIVQNKKYEKVTSGVKVPPPAPAAATTGR